MPEWIWILKGKMVPGAGIEPAQPLGPRDFKSLASTYSATRACGLKDALIADCVIWILEMKKYFKQKDWCPIREIDNHFL